MEDNITYTIGELAREFDITPRAIRHYEDEGLLRPERQGLNRIYRKADRVRLILILRGKRLGFTLQETRELFEIYDAAQDERPQLQKLLAQLDEKRQQLLAQRTDLDAALQEIESLSANCSRLLQTQP